MGIIIRLAFCLAFAPAISAAIVPSGAPHLLTESPAVNVTLGSRPEIAAGTRGFMAVWWQAGAWAMPLADDGRPARNAAVSLPTRSDDYAIAAAGDGFAVLSADFEGVTRTLLNADGSLIAPEILLAPASNASNVSATASRDGVTLVTWTVRGEQEVLYGLLADTLLNVIHEPFTIATRAGASAGTRDVPSVASDGQGFLISWIDQSGAAISTVAISNTGELQPGRILTGGPAAETDAAADAEGYVVAWREATRVRAVRLEDGHAATPVDLVEVAAGIRNLALVAAGELTIVIETETRETCGWTPVNSLVALRITSELRPIGAPYTLSPSPGSNRNPSAASKGQRAVIVWEHGGCDGVNGVLAAPPGEAAAPISLRVQDGRLFDPAIASDGARALVAWTGMVGDDAAPQVRACLVDAAGSPLRPVSITTSGTSTTRPRVAWDGSRYLVVWHQLNGVDASIRACFVDRHGNADAEFTIGIAGAAARIDVTHEPASGFAVAWSGGTTVQVARVSSAGVVRAVAEFPDFDAAYSDVRLAASPGELLLTYGTRTVSIGPSPPVIWTSTFERVAISQGAVRQTRMMGVGCVSSKCVDGYLPSGTIWNGSGYTTVWTTVTHPAYRFVIHAMPLLPGGSAAAAAASTPAMPHGYGPRIEGRVAWNGSFVATVFSGAMYNDGLIVMGLTPEGRAADSGTVLVGRRVRSADIAAVGTSFLAVYAESGHVWTMPLALAPPPRRRAVR
jgi:hypothetical protein